MRRDSTGCEVLNAVHWSVEEQLELFLLQLASASKEHLKLVM